LRNDHLNPLVIIFFIIAIFKRFEISVVGYVINQNLKNALVVALVELLGNTSVIGSSKVAISIYLDREGCRENQWVETLLLVIFVLYLFGELCKA